MLHLSEREFAAVYVRKLLEADSGAVDVENLGRLKGDYYQVALGVISEGPSRERRKSRLRAECNARDALGGFLTDVDLASVQVDLSSVELGRWDIQPLEKALEAISPPDWIIKPWVQKPSLNLWFGKPKSLKSMIAVDLLMCIASGTNWLAKPGKRESTGHPVAKTGVLLIDLENGAAILKQRLAAFTKAYDRGGKETNFFGLRCRLHGLISVSRKALLC